MRYSRVQSIALADINPNIKPVYWTKGKQKPCNRYTYYERIAFHITKGGDTYDLEKAIRCYNAGREITLYIEKRMFGLIRNSENVTDGITRREIFTRDRKNNPLTQDDINYIIAKDVDARLNIWKQENR